MFVLLIGEYSSTCVNGSSIPCVCCMRLIHCPPSSFFAYLNLFFFALNVLFLSCRLIYTARPHAPRTEKVVGIGFQPGFDPYKVNTSTYLHCYVF
jgi:hypothetical protein